MDGFYSYSKGESSNPPVICVHGLMGSARNLYRVVQAIADAGYHVFAYDQRGHGHSPHGGPYTLESLADDLFDFMDAQKLESAHLVGHSLGARVCLRAAGSRPSRVSSLVMLDAGTRPTDEGHDDVKQVVFAVADSYANKADAERDLSRFPERTKQFLLANLRERDGRLAWIFDLSGIRHELFASLRLDQSELWENVNCPSLVVRGDRSEYLPQQELDRMQRLNARARSAVVPNAGHWLHVDNFVETTRLVIEFLNSVRDES